MTHLPPSAVISGTVADPSCLDIDRMPVVAELPASPCCGERIIHAVDCVHCDGLGYHRPDADTYEDCAHCAGRGELRVRRCLACDRPLFSQDVVLILLRAARRWSVLIVARPGARKVVEVEGVAAEGRAA